VGAEKPLFGLSYASNDKIKVSARLAKNLEGINLRELLVKAINIIGGEAGGHQFSAGALIEKDKEQEFIDIVNNLLGELIGNKED
jgi:RecJ-like exonuclease